MSQTKYITIVHFTAFSRPMKEAFVDDELIMRYNLKRRILQICSTSIITKIEYYEGGLINLETFKYEPDLNHKLETMKKTFQ